MEGKVFFLSPTCGALRMMMIKSMIEKSGGLVEKREGARADYFVFDKTVAACRKKVEDLRRSFQRFEGAKPVHVQWLEQTLSSEEERERDAEEGRERESLERILAEESRFTPYAPNERRGRPVLSGHFEHALLDILDNLGKHRSSVLLEDKRCVVIYDGFPKARFRLRGALFQNRIPFYFDSPCLKNKKHWNSFQPPFFIDSGMLMEDLERNGKISINKEQALQWLKDDMISHRTEEKMKNIPALKDHLARHNVQETSMYR
ncbi:hypothetical protein GUITHDRAFT_134117 [Guillardia theta CCMP2712]|uniref:BRCT domain-containing protein n=1 Tax=Guillardia theta (strain CCMP2712) TaxID=905079 RepID=L1JUI8_GUITC|nr:hypothetical protein GUITHDRAFT_134117 [Guillardia theta CCMP2712]EKX51753.1 hypothetical protein GUITHDRAFT_134117 [Guillardia theta CCMP2712]|eukprot:XP_005838733.1 hypothetical protein GUITHDRAFT_134117 [Guillardia theta CCMP2712]